MDKSKRKEFVCQYCNSKFTVPYIGHKSGKVVKTCSNCIPLVKAKAAVIKNKGRRDLNKLILDAIDIISKAKTSPTMVSVCKQLKCSNKTMIKALKKEETTFSTLVNTYCTVKCKSKFQSAILLTLHEVYPNVEIVTEKYFDDLRSSKGYLLKVDIYLPTLNTVIECDGEQHNNANHYYNILAAKAGHCTSIESDILKQEYCNNNSINLIRIPYTKNVTVDYVREYIK